MAKKNKKINRVIGYLLNVLIIIVSILIIIGIYYIVQIKILKNEYANLFGYTFFEVATGSMSDTIEIGDVVIVKLTNNVKENDIIVYKDEDNFVTHRLIKKDGNNLIAKGDANNSEDRPIVLDQILGQVIGIIPKVGIWKKVILSPEVIGLTISLIIILAITYIYTSKTEEKND